MNRENLRGIENVISHEGYSDEERLDAIRKVCEMHLPIRKVYLGIALRWVVKFFTELMTEYALNLEKYRWHDLRKDPEDLPNTMDQVQICWIGGNNLWYDSMFWDDKKKVFSINSGTEFAVAHPVYGDDRRSSYGWAVAWREIEPFEEVGGDHIDEQ